MAWAWGLGLGVDAAAGRRGTSDIRREVIRTFAIGWSFMVVAIGLFVARVPERWFPGRFDLLFHSHNLFHITTVGGSICGCHLRMDCWAGGGQGPVVRSHLRALDVLSGQQTLEGTLEGS